MTYRSVLYLKSKLKTFPFDHILSGFGLQSIFDEIGSNKVVSFFYANFMNAENCKIWHFLKYQFFRFFIISLIIFDLQECTIPQVKAKDLLFWPYFVRFLAKINTSWYRKTWSCLVLFYSDFRKQLIFSYSNRKGEKFRYIPGTTSNIAGSKKNKMI